MNKKKLNVEGINLAYLEQNNGQNHGTIFFIHGNSSSSNTWRKQLNDSIFMNYRLIVIDLPAHGNSGPAPDISYYTLPHLASVMKEAISKLSNDERYIVAGLSLSTNIVSEMLSFDLSPKGLILAGPSIIGKGLSVGDIIKPGTFVNVVFNDEPDRDEVKCYAKETSSSNDENDHRLFLTDFYAVQGHFRSALAQSIGVANYSDEIRLLQDKNVPLLIIFGEDEKIIQNNYLDNVPLPLWRNKIFKLPKASHLVNIDQPEEFNKLIKKFADDCFK